MAPPDLSRCEKLYRSEGIGSQPNPLAAVVHSNYFASLHAQRSLAILFFDYFLDVGGAHDDSPIYKAGHILGFDCLIASAAFGIKELQQFLECFRISGVSQKSAFATYVHELFILQFLQMVRKRGIRNSSSD